MADLEYEPGVVYSVSGVAELEAGAVGASDTEFAAARVAAGEDGVMLYLIYAFAAWVAGGTVAGDE